MYKERGSESIPGRENRPMQRLCGGRDQGQKEELEKTKEDE